MFKWVKIHGCNCSPLDSGAEKYILNVGDVWGGIVQSSLDELDNGRVIWESWYTVFDKNVSGQTGGPYDRQYSMDWIEERITESLSQIGIVDDDPSRVIVDGLGNVVERCDRKTNVKPYDPKPSPLGTNVPMPSPEGTIMGSITATSKSKKRWWKFW